MALSHRSLGLGGRLSRLISTVFENWFLIVIVTFFASPIGPHMRWTYEFTDYYSNQRHYSYCDYVGSRGLIKPNLEPDCPFFAFLDTRDWK